MDRAAARLVVGALLAAALAGCTKTIELERVPGFYDGQIKTVAVAPFNNRSSQPVADELVAGRLAAMLAANGTYQVIAPDELKARLRGAELTMPADGDPKAVAAMLGQWDDIDAVITGTVEAFDVDHYSYIDIDHYHNYPRWPYHGFHSAHGYNYYYPTVTRYNSSLAYLSVTAAMTRVPDGRPLQSATVAAAAESVSHYHRRGAVQARLRQAVDEAGAELVKVFARTPVKVEVDPRKVLRTARGGDAGDLEFTDDFSPTDPNLVVVVELPPAAVNNHFRVVITPAGSDAVLAEESFVWGQNDLQQQLVFSPAPLAEQVQGDDFVVSLYRQGKLLLERDFEIE